MSDQPIKIVFIVGGGRSFGDALPLGGAASYMKAAGRVLPKERYDPVFFFLFDGPSVRDFEAAGFRTVVVKRRFRGDFSLVWRLAAALRREAPGVVVTGVANANLYGRLAAKVAGVPALVTVIHDFCRGIMGGARSSPFLEWLALWQEKIFWRLNSRVVAVSGPLRDHLVSAWGMPADRVVSIPGVVETAAPPPDAERVAAMRRRIGAAPGDFVVGILCRIAFVKNLAMFLRVARRVGGEMSRRVRFAVAGEGPQREALEEEARRAGLDGTVCFTGWLDDAEAFAAAADVHLLTSWSESQGISLLEAMAASRPVVAAAVGGVVEVVADGETGFLVDPDDDEVMARHVVELARDPELARAMGAAGRRRAEEVFSPRRMGGAFEELIADVLPGVRPAVASVAMNPEGLP
jgi:glycosyltransferase involved in cell wall biosynthesis